MSASFPKLHREPLFLQVARHLRAAILAGEIAEGTPIPSEKQLAEDLGVGRSTVREALRVLQAQGLISGGDRVTTRQPTASHDGALPNAVQALETLLLLDAVPLPDIVDLRVTLEQAAIRDAARCRDPEALEVAEQALKRMAEALEDPECFHEADVAFHEALVAAGGNAAYGLVMKVLRGTTARHLREALTSEDRLPKVTAGLLKEHEAILQAIREGQPGAAAERLSSHIRHFYERHVS